MDALQSAFIAIPLEGVAKEAFQELQGRLRPWESFLRFQSAETPHLTLYFWKELSPIEYTQALAQFSKIAASTEPFALSINDIETFGSKEGDRVLYLSVAFSPELAVLKKKCPWANGPDNPFHPHITLAFIEHPQRFLVEKKKISRHLVMWILRFQWIVSGSTHRLTARSRPRSNNIYWENNASSW